MGLVKVVEQLIYVGNFSVGGFNSIRIVDKHFLIVLVQWIQIIDFYWLLFYLQEKKGFELPSGKFNMEENMILGLELIDVMKLKTYF